MKKSLLLLLAAGIWSASFGQNSSNVKPKYYTVSPIKLAQMRMQAKQTGEKPSTTQSNSTKRVTRTANLSNLPFVGSAANINGTLDATTTAVSANQATGVISMTHRDNQTNVAACGTGAYISGFSTNGGTTWDSTIVTFCDANPDSGSRYPNGVLFNPAGNTSPSNVYNVMAGPYTNGSATGDGWTATVYGSVTLGNAHDFGFKWQNTKVGVERQNNGDLSFMTSCDDSTVHVIGQGFKTNASGNFTNWLGAVLTTGKYNPAADSFTWTQTEFRPHLVPGYKGWNALSPYDTLAGPLAVPGTAWSQDGKTGYVVILGNMDSTGYNFYSDQPIVYKTTNSGQTWAMMPLYDFRKLPSLTTYLEASMDSGYKSPIWFTFETNGTNSQGATNSWDLTVDYQGNLHIFSAIVSSYYTNPDSSYSLHYFSNESGYIYDVYTTTATGGWQARLIDSMATLPCHNVAQNGGNPDWDSTSGNVVGFGNRLQASRTTDGKHLFCTWEDDLSGFLAPYLAFPDVKGQAYDVPSNKSGKSYRITNTLNNYFLCVSDIALVNNGPDTIYTIPCTIASPEEGQLTNDGTKPISYYYLGAVYYNDSLVANPEAIQNIASQPSGFSVTPNYPNPFSNVTYFNVSLTEQSTVGVDVYNIFGQEVYSIPAQQMSPGTHLMSLNGSSLSSGVYLYRVTSNGYAVTNKMVVQ